MAVKEYNLSVRSVAPRDRRKTVSRTTGTGGTVYVTVNRTGVSVDDQEKPAVPVPNTSKTTWRLIPTPTAVKVSDGEKAAWVSCKVERNCDGTVETISGTSNLEILNVRVWVKIDDKEWQPYIQGSGKRISVGGKYLVAGISGKAITTLGDDTDSSVVRNMITFELRDLVTGAVLASVNVPVVRDGVPGKAGAAGAMVYPAGIFDPDKTYSADNGACPVVQYEGNYYLLKPGCVFDAVNGDSNEPNPASSAALGGKWQLFENFSQVFADVLMANFAKISSAVFYGDYMFSQEGTINGEPCAGVDEEGRPWFKKFIDGALPGSFIPNICFDFRKGDGIFSGDVRTTFIDADKSDAVSEKEGVYIVKHNRKLLACGNGDIFILPDNSESIGARIMICDPRQTCSSSQNATVIQVENSGRIIGVIPENTGLTTTNAGVLRIDFFAGVCELVAIPKPKKMTIAGPVRPVGCQWVVLSFAARYTGTSDTIIRYEGDIIRPIGPSIPIFQDLDGDQIITPTT